ncbi:solute carrier family 23 member 2-like [Homarus americanus]|uniref:Solute carrier family 23 member 2-like n=1 Tax=Homarus americanus TaxID=6706 RepID=A0A8J5NBD6_HOMAM|nr:solute carrier family 23 member 2-like [Homarus americanus]KAG7177561.1 Solute carrier family 23 member 2-like [Homarus americanus]
MKASTSKQSEANSLDPQDERWSLRTDGDSPDDDLIYTVEDVPPWYLSIFFGFQHYLTMAGGTVAIPILVASFLCMSEDDPARGALVSTVFFHSGIVTLLQTTFGVRLPIIQGGDFAYVVPTIALLTTAYEPCNSICLGNLTTTEKEEVWQVRLREVQGSIAVASLFQIILGFTGLIGLLLRWITPLSIVPTVTLVGLSLFDLSAEKASQHWGISIMTMALLIIFSQYLSNTSLPVPVFGSKGRGVKVAKTQFFKCFPVLTTVFLSWSICAILTAFDVLPKGSPARTDTTGTLLEKSPWFRVPYPGQWGTPTVTVVGVIGMLGGAVASIIESIGDYYVCAKISGAPPPPVNAINRGVGMEGIGCLLAGLLGTGNGTTSCSQNIGVISVTKVGSRRVVQFSAVILIVSGVFSKLGAVFVTIPEPVMAGVFITMFSMITAVGLTPLQYVNLRSSRNIFVLGHSIFLGLSVSKWIEGSPDVIQTGWPILDQVLRVLLQTPMFVGGSLGFFLDNTIPGTAEERGLLEWNRHLYQSSTTHKVSVCYDMPWGMAAIRRVKWLRYLPFSPTFSGFRRNKYVETVNDAEKNDILKP